jgi:hypothetical protein
MGATHEKCLGFEEPNFLTVPLEPGLLSELKTETPLHFSHPPILAGAAHSSPRFSA